MVRFFFIGWTVGAVLRDFLDELARIRGRGNR